MYVQDELGWRVSNPYRKCYLIWSNYPGNSNLFLLPSSGIPRPQLQSRLPQVQWRTSRKYLHLTVKLPVCHSFGAGSHHRVTCSMKASVDQQHLRSLDSALVTPRVYPSMGMEPFLCPCVFSLILSSTHHKLILLLVPSNTSWRASA